VKTSNLLSLFLLLLAAACGEGGKSSASLKVSQNFIMSAPYFGGGFLIQGRNALTNESFVFDLSNGAEVKQTLSKGTWTFSAIGWDGSTKFSGTPYCGHAQKNLALDSEVVDISISALGCSHDFFSKGYVDTSSSPQTFKKLGYLSTCGTFTAVEVTPETSILASLVTATTDFRFCANNQEQSSDVKSFKIYALKKNLTEATHTLASASACISSANGAFDLRSQDIRLPYGGLPFAIVAYAEVNCPAAERVAQFDFMQGLASETSGEFDKRLFTDGGNALTTPFTPIAVDATATKLFLPGNETKRAISPLAHLRPAILCDDGSTTFKCSSSVPWSYDYHAFQSAPKELVFPDSSSCSTFSSDPNLSASCNDASGKVIVTVNPTAFGGPYNFQLEGQTYAVKVFENLTEYQQASYFSHYLTRVIGSSNPLLRPTFYGSQNDNDEIVHHGILQEVREMFSGRGAAGLFTPTNLLATTTYKNYCLSLTGSRDISFYDHEELKFENYRVQILNSALANEYIFFDATTEKKMLIFDLNKSAMIPEMIIDFNCTKLIGRFEDFSEKTNGSSKVIQRNIVTWNAEGVHTTDTSTQRLDHTGRRTEYELVSSSWSLLREHRELNRLVKIDGDELHHWHTRVALERQASSWGRFFDNYVGMNPSDEPDKICYGRTSGTDTVAEDERFLSGRDEPSNSDIFSAPISLLDFSSAPAGQFDLATWGNEAPSCSFMMIPSIGDGTQVNGIELNPDQLFTDAIPNSFTIDY
jgi:hypothetical protein